MARKSKEESKKYPEYYKKNFPLWTVEQCENAAKNFRKSCNNNSIEYWIIKHPELSKEECNKLRKEYIEKKKIKNPNYLQYYINKFPNLSENECKEKLQQYRDSINPCIPSYWKTKYPEKTLEECKEIAFKERKKRKIKSDNHGANNPMHRSRVSLQKTKECSPMCIEFYQKHYPNLSKEEQESMWRAKHDEMSESMRNAIKSTNIEYYLNQGMSEDDAKKALHDRQLTFTLEKCIKKYGEKEGIEKYNERQNKWKAKLRKSFLIDGDSRGTQSQVANKLFDDISNLLNIENPIKEKFIYDKETKYGYVYDFCYNNKIIEFNGDYWHCNPRKYKEDYINKTTKMTAKEIWKKDEEKKRIAEKFGYKVYYVWEMDYRKDPSSELIKCIKFLQS